MTYRAILTAALLLLLLPVEARAEVELSLLYPQPSLYQEPLEKIVSAFAHQRPDVKIKLLAPTKSYEEAASAVLRGAVTRNIPDIVFNGTNLIGLFVERNLAVPLDDFVKAEPDWDKQGYVADMVATGKASGKLYAMPFALSTPLLYINEDLVQRAGGPTSPPATWPDLLGVAEKINAPSDGTSGAYLVWSTTGNYLWQQLLFTHGGQLLADDGKSVGFNTPEGLKTFEVLRDLVARAGMQNYTDEQGTQAFIAGKIGFYMASSARVNNLTKQIGGRFKLRTAPFPSPTNTSRVVSGGASMMIFAKDAEKQKAAWAFLKFASGAEAQTIMVRHIGYMPCNSIAIETPSMLGDYYRDNPNMRTAISQRDRTTTWLGFPGDNNLKAIRVIHDSMESVVLGKATPEAALANAVKNVDALLLK